MPCAHEVSLARALAAILGDQPEQPRGHCQPQATTTGVDEQMAHASEVRCKTTLIMGPPGGLLPSAGDAPHSMLQVGISFLGGPFLSSFKGGPTKILGFPILPHAGGKGTISKKLIKARLVEVFRGVFLSGCGSKTQNRPPPQPPVCGNRPHNRRFFLVLNFEQHT